MATKVSIPAASGWRRRLKYGLLAILIVVVVVGGYLIARQGWAMWHFQSAQAAIERRDFASAQYHLDQSLRVWPDSGETVFLAARTARRAGNLDAAEQHLTNAQRVNWVPEAIAIERNLLRAQQGDYIAVLPYLRNCLRRDHPDSVLILEVLAPILARAFDIGFALECLESWREKDPANHRPYLHTAELAERMHDPHQAIAMYSKALERAPGNAIVEFRLGAVLLERKRPKEALPHLEFARQHAFEATGIEPMLIAVTYAQCLHDLGRDEEARRVLREAADPQSTDARILALQGVIELDAGNLDVAEGYLRRAAKDRRNESVLLSNLERCLRLNRKTAEADEVKKRVDAVNRDLKELNALMIQVRNEPANPEPRRQVAIRLMRNGLEHEARRWLESGLQQDPFHGPTYETLAEYCEMTGDLARAKEFRERAKVLAKKP